MYPTGLVTRISRHLDASPAALRLPAPERRWSQGVNATRRTVAIAVELVRILDAHLAAATGASTRELMARLGYSTPRASLIYQHATKQRDRQIAEGIDAILEAAKASSREPSAPIVDLDASRTPAC